VIRVSVNGVEQVFEDSNIRTDLPTVKEMQDIVRLYIYKNTGDQINIVLNQKNLNMELILLERAYKTAVHFLHNNNF
jgi:hypothetical protein